MSNHFNEMIMENLFDKFYHDAIRHGLSVYEAETQAATKARKAWEDYPDV
jgi:hypothetical protein